MKFLAKAILVIVCMFSACSLRAENFVDSQALLQQKLEVFGLAGTPWESETSYDEERSRAWMDALHHAYERILALPLMEGKQVAHVLQENAALKERLGLVLMSAPKTFFQPDISGMVRCRVDVPLTGKISRARLCILRHCARSRCSRPAFSLPGPAELKLMKRWLHQNSAVLLLMPAVFTLSRLFSHGFSTLREC